MAARVPLSHLTRAALEDENAMLIDTLMAHRAYALEIEDRLLHAMRLVGQVRRGLYDPEQAAAPRLRVSRDPEQLPLWVRLNA